jgi:hypothetical protein
MKTVKSFLDGLFFIGLHPGEAMVVVATLARRNSINKFERRFIAEKETGVSVQTNQRYSQSAIVICGRRNLLF